MYQEVHLTRQGPAAPEPGLSATQPVAGCPWCWELGLLPCRFLLQSSVPGTWLSTKWVLCERHSVLGEHVCEDGL